MAEDKDGQGAGVAEGGESAAAENEATPEGNLEAALIAARTAAEQHKDQALRAMAETENVRRRFQREREDLLRYANADIVKELLPAVDNLRRALEAIPADARSQDQLLDTLATGVEMTERQLLSALERFNIRKVDPQGERFDANRHQAMFEVPNSDQPAGTVVQVVQPGYMLHDRLLRPALVGVAKGGAAPRAGGNGHAAAANPGQFDTTA
jgi:molecular chaperone GrpE